MNFEPGTPFTINSRKYDGSIRRSWKCDFTASTDDSIDLVGRFEKAVEHPDLGRIEQGTVSRERFYLSRWYNYFRFEHPDGTLRNYYINICMPPLVRPGVIDYVDLDIDVIVWPDGEWKTLDRDEFEINANTFGYPDDVRLFAVKALEDIIAVVSKNSGKTSELSATL
jgi:protein associated with RNAse G/E